MTKKIITDHGEYELIKNYRDAFNEEEFLSKCTDFFNSYDYIVGDIAYGKLRLKGFYDKNNKRVKKINNYNNVEKYLKENCAVDCKHFIVKRSNKNEV